MSSNLVMANRAILLVPLFNLDTQAQAIKVHLIEGLCLSYKSDQ